MLYRVHLSEYVKAFEQKKVAENSKYFSSPFCCKQNKKPEVISIEEESNKIAPENDVQNGNEKHCQESQGFFMLKTKISFYNKYTTLFSLVVTFFFHLPIFFYCQ